MDKKTVYEGKFWVKIILYWCIAAFIEVKNACFPVSCIYKTSWKPFLQNNLVLNLTNFKSVSLPV
jgi:hypothetical protein